jgi:hypothetical protein
VKLLGSPPATGQIRAIVQLLDDAGAKGGGRGFIATPGVSEPIGEGE